MVASLLPGMSGLFEEEVPADEVQGLAEELLEAESDESFPIEYSLTSYGADYPVDGLVKRIKSGAIFIPKFQRSYVWNIYKASRFIESLLLGLPVPAIFLSREIDSQKLLVIDGQQRLRTLQYFFDGVFVPQKVEFSLKGVSRHLIDKTYATLTPDERLRLDDSIIHAIVVRQEEPNESGGMEGSPSSVYHIFERLNTGGVLLHPQEIRTCIFHGPFVDLLQELNDVPAWRTLFGKSSTRMRDRELILRFLALFHDGNRYQRPMKEFLNRFAKKHRHLSPAQATAFRQTFVGTVDSVLEAFGKSAFRPSRVVNAAVADSVCVGMARRLERGPINDKVLLAERFHQLINCGGFLDAITTSTTNEENVEERIRLATAAFGDVP